MDILVACEESQAVCKELRKRGHEAYSCDILPCSGGYPEWHIKADVMSLINGNCSFTTETGDEWSIEGEWDMIIAFPPCTHLCCSGQRWFTEGKKDRKLQEQAKEFFLKIANANCSKIAIENPVGIMSTAWRKPDQIIQPWQFGETDNKRTCLWLKNLPKLIPTNIIEPSKRTNNNWKAVFNEKQYSWNDPRVAGLRSKTYPGIAEAMAEQWAPMEERL